MNKQVRVLCGVPEEHCCGGHLHTDQHFHTKKAHSSRDDAFRCMTRYLTTVLGYRKVGARELAPPDGGPIRILPKKSKYGGLLVRGKLGERYMPEVRRAGNRGVII